MSQRYRVHVADPASGREGVMTVTANSPDEARQRASAAGHIVGRIELADAPAGGGGGASGSGGVAARSAGGGTSGASNALTLLALLVGGAALALHFVLPPRLPGKSLSSYDFSTPKAALVSLDTMERDRDLRARLEMDAEKDRKSLDEKLRTLEVRKEGEVVGRKILFIVYERDGVKRFETAAFEKDASTGQWSMTYMSADTVERDNAPLAESMRTWVAKGEL